MQFLMQGLRGEIKTQKIIVSNTQVQMYVEIIFFGLLGYTLNYLVHDCLIFFI